MTLRASRRTLARMFAGRLGVQGGELGPCPVLLGGGGVAAQHRGVRPPGQRHQRGLRAAGAGEHPRVARADTVAVGCKCERSMQPRPALAGAARMSRPGADTPTVAQCDEIAPDGSRVQPQEGITIPLACALADAALPGAGGITMRNSD